MADETIGLIPLGYDAAAFLSNIADSLEETLSSALPSGLTITVELAPQMPLSRAAFDRRRGQYMASALLETLSRGIGPRSKLLGVTDRDLFEPGVPYLFGAARLDLRTAVVSTARLGSGTGPGTPVPGRAEYRLLFERTLKEAAHEAGHLFGLPHCPNPVCLMHVSGALEATDRKKREFCPECRSRLTLKK